MATREITTHRYGENQYDGWVVADGDGNESMVADPQTDLTQSVELANRNVTLLDASTGSSSAASVPLPPNQTLQETTGNLTDRSVTVALPHTIPRSSDNTPLQSTVPSTASHEKSDDAPTILPNGGTSCVDRIVSCFSCCWPKGKGNRMD